MLPFTASLTFLFLHLSCLRILVSRDLMLLVSASPMHLFVPLLNPLLSKVCWLLSAGAGQVALGHMVVWEGGGMPGGWLAQWLLEVPWDVN